MTGFWISLLFVSLPLMGDKTQLVALAFASRYRATTVLAAVFVATLAIHLGSVFLGEAAGMALPLFWINLLAGLSFLAFGVWTLRGDTLDDDQTRKERRVWAFPPRGLTPLPPPPGAQKPPTPTPHPP